MKTLFILLITITSLNFNNLQDLKTEELIFVQSEDVYAYFAKGEEEALEFLIDSSISDEYDLTNDSYKGKEFKVTYETVTEFDEFEEEIDVRTITKLELIE